MVASTARGERSSAMRANQHASNATSSASSVPSHVLSYQADRVEFSTKNIRSPESPHHPIDHASDPSTLPRRGRGRPRRDWATSLKPPRTTASTSTSSPSNAAPSTTPSTPDPSHCTLNVADAELPLHFITLTAPTLAGTTNPTNRIHRFWSHNVPHLGLSHPFILHLSFAAAGYHLLHLHPKGPPTRRKHSEQHASSGLSQLTSALPTLNATNAGALYVAAVLVCYCTFAAGPTGPDDVLVCNVGNEDAVPWLPLTHGVRLIRSLVEPGVLFAGLMAPLGPSDEQDDGDHRPACAREGFPRIEWEEALSELRRVTDRMWMCVCAPWTR
ncbi:hypothetical protein V502_01562 [Pseudogymnoascus sp. VKM F-4520 (FW-2644)]|nr:hypothetical protein V502_01562 [Pseudogymnoascus sp. VKM F-4520 (FW-2644)]